MGNANTKEARPPLQSSLPHTSSTSSAITRARAAGGSSGSAHSSHRHHRLPHATSSSSSTSRHHYHHLRGNRNDLSLLLDNERDVVSIPPRRETKQDREARKRQKEQAQREEERARSVREEHVDGGYLVALGIYIGHEDWNKKIVRRFIIDRRLAPYWRGLNDMDESWADHQFIAAARGLDVPPRDVIPPELQVGYTATTGETDQSQLYTATGSQHATSTPVNLPPRAGKADASLSQSGPPPSTTSHSTTNRLLRARAKTLTAISSKHAANNDSDADANQPQEYKLPGDRTVNGQPLEVFLYKNATECPICFLYYPPYLNQTRCCQQPICTECFVKIKRPDPHLPEHHPDEQQDSSAETAHAVGEDEQLISEPATCPYCTQPEFGVTYQPPPFRRGLSYTPPSLTTMTTVPSHSEDPTETDIRETLAPTITATRPRAHSLPPNAPGVITTDMIRPDWAQKLQNARDHAARRAAAATALHTAAYRDTHAASTHERHLPVLGRRGVLRRGHHDRQQAQDGSSANLVGAAVAAVSAAVGGGVEEGGPGNDNDSGRRSARDVRRALLSDPHSQPGSRSTSATTTRRRDPVRRVEDVMLHEAIRQSIITEEERRKKEVKGARKEAKKREKEAKKADKQARKMGLAVGAGAAGGVRTGASSSVSLPLRGHSSGSGSGNASAGSSQAQVQQHMQIRTQGQPSSKGKDPVAASTSTTTPSTSAYGHPLSQQQQQGAPTVNLDTSYLPDSDTVEESWMTIPDNEASLLDSDPYEISRMQTPLQPQAPSPKRNQAADQAQPPSPDRSRSQTHLQYPPGPPSQPRTRSQSHSHSRVPSGMQSDTTLASSQPSPGLSAAALGIDGPGKFVQLQQQSQSRRDLSQGSNAGVGMAAVDDKKPLPVGSVEVLQETVARQG